MAEIGNSTSIWTTSRTMPLAGAPATGPLTTPAGDAAPALAGDTYQGASLGAPAAGSPYSDVVARAMAAQAAAIEGQSTEGQSPASPPSSENSGLWTDPVSTPLWEQPGYTEPTEVAPEPPPPAPPVEPKPTPDPPPPAPEPEAPTYTEQWSDAIGGGTFKSWGDPHEVSGDGLKFDNYKTGTFLAFRSTEGDLELQKRQERLNDKETGIFNVAAGLKVGANQIAYEAGSNALTINGQRRAIKPGDSFTLPDGTRLSIGYNPGKTGEKDESKPSITVTSPRGDRITMLDQGNYMDFEGEISSQRASGSVFGSLGTFDADSNQHNDMRMPDGQVTKDVDAFLEAWRLRQGALV
jgi:hypothetical protein